jgi:hypothetical protein
MMRAGTSSHGANADKLLIIHRPYAIPFHAGIYPKGCAQPKRWVRACGWKEPKAPRPDDKKRVSNAFTHSLTPSLRSRMRRERSNLKWRVFVQLRWKNCARRYVRERVDALCIMNLPLEKGGNHLRRFVRKLLKCQSWIQNAYFISGKMHPPC